MTDKSTLLTKPECIVLKDIPFCIDSEKLIRRLSFHTGKAVNRSDIQHLIDNVKLFAGPCAMYKSCQVRKHSGETMLIEGTAFSNSLLNTNLKNVEVVFPFVSSCGKGIDSLISQSDPDQKYSLAIITEMVLEDVSKYLQNVITSSYNLDYLWQLKPGYFQAWPVNDRVKLFSVLGDVENILGIKLENDYSLYPSSSDCGIFYHADVEFEACQVCRQDPCMGRRAPYSEELSIKFANKARKPCGSRV